jgi:hypothetical protein
MNLLERIRDRRRHPGESPAMRQMRRMIEASSQANARLRPPVFPRTRPSHLHDVDGRVVGVRMSMTPEPPADDVPRRREASAATDAPPAAG